MDVSRVAAAPAAALLAPLRPISPAAAAARQAPDFADAAQAEAGRLASEYGLKFQPGDMVAEVCTPGFDKGAALRAFMRERPFDRGAPVFVGDDLTDEHGFEAARALGGVGVLVGPARPTAGTPRGRIEERPEQRRGRRGERDLLGRHGGRRHAL